MLNVTTTDAIGMAVAAICLVSLALWAQGFRTRARDLIGSRNIFFAISGVLLVVSLGSILFKGFNFGMDFAGGTIVEIGFVENRDAITPEAVRNQIHAFAAEKQIELQDPQVQVEEKALRATEDPYRRVIIRLGKADQTRVTTEEVEGMAAYLESKLGALYRQSGKSLETGEEPGAPGESPSGSPASTPSGAPEAAASAAPEATASGAPASAPSGAPEAAASGAPASTASASPDVSASGAPSPPASGSPQAAQKQADASISGAILSRETIDPIIGRELFTNSLLALVVALMLQLIYITLRFGNQVRYGLAADVALVHDVIIMAGLYSLTSRQVDSPFLAAVLTVIGYSVMDSIVVFDRIRENVRHVRKGNYAEICNASVNQTMSRSVNTTLTVLLTLFALFFFGGDTLRNFAFALLVGIACGAYSSIFIAAPLVVIFDDWAKKREEERVTERRRAREAVAGGTPGGRAAGAQWVADEAGMKRRATDASTVTEDYPDATDIEDDDTRRPSDRRRRNRTRRRR